MDTTAYYQAVAASDDALAARLRQIRAAEDSGAINVREAADMRVSAMAEHLAACADARVKHLGGAA